MNVREGALRMQRVGRGILFFATATLVLTIVIGIVMHFAANMGASVFLLGTAIPLVMYLSFFPALCGGLLWIAGWIVEGFAMPKADNASTMDGTVSSAHSQQG